MSRRYRKGQRGQQLSGAMRRDIANIVAMYLAADEHPMQAVIKTDAWIRKAYPPRWWRKAHRFAYMVENAAGQSLPLSTYDIMWLRAQKIALVGLASTPSEEGKAAFWLAVYRYFDGLVPDRVYVLVGVEPPPQVDP